MDNIGEYEVGDNGLIIYKSPLLSLGLPIFLLLVLGSVGVIGYRFYRQAPIAQVVVNSDGLSLQQYQQLNRALQAQPKGSFFSTNLTGLLHIAYSLPWVDEVSVTRDWQQGIRVNAFARQPVAKFGSERLVDAQGEVYVPATPSELNQPELANLQGDRSQAKLIMQQMQQVNGWFDPLGLKVKELILTPRMTWVIRFDNGLRVIVDGENTTEKLMGLSSILQNQLHERLKQMQVVDLRYKNGFAISWVAEAQSSPEKIN